MEPFKNLLNATGVRQAAGWLQAQDAGFDADRFTRLATDGLDALEMKGRAIHICQALEATLPADFDAACTLLERALAPVDGSGEAPGLRGWFLWSAGEFVARRGLGQPERALQALHAFTQRFTAEFAIRPFIVQHPELTFATLHRWCGDASAHVRRLVSEGSRPRLPWGLQLKALIRDPSPTLPLLLKLQDDDSEYVRRSVANHLNDIAKDHPQLIAQWLEQHLPDAPPARRALLKHASRTLVKKGDARILKLWGFGGTFRGQAQLALQPPRVAVGGEVAMTLHLQSTAARAQTLVIDYAVHHVKANGSTSPKVFKGWTVTLPPRGALTLTRRHSMKPVTTRRYFPGVHRMTVHVNGTAVAEAAFTLAVPKAAKG